jgi:hemoglobin
MKPFAVPMPAALLMALLALLLAACAAQPKSDPAPAAAPAAAPATPPPLLYDALGGQAGIEGFVDVLIGEVHADKRIIGLFRTTDMPEFRRLLIEQLCEVTGGPCIYGGRTMEEAHSGLAITHQEFVFFVEDLNRAMKKAALPPEIQQRVLALLGPMEPQVINQ